MSDVRPREGGPYSLYCHDCDTWIPNTASAEMRKEGYFEYSHMCDGASESSENDLQPLSSEIDTAMYAISEAFMMLRSAVNKAHYGEVTDIKGAAEVLGQKNTELLDKIIQIKDLAE